MVMFLAYEDICVKLTSSNVVEMEALYCTHEEADTRILLHAENATEYEAVVLVCEDTDVLLLAISKAADLEIPVYQKRGTENRTRYINVTSISKSVGEIIAASLPGIHAFTGCDTVSSFAGKGKNESFKLLQKSTVYQEAFVQLGAQLQVPHIF